ncbi:MAG TPA: PhzF family phenazine biosynthesis protein [Bryobacteraceae bacterium]|nr:PhzF family phenazine biosynthesis protein [Bryobacteraceae bacterium]
MSWLRIPVYQVDAFSSRVFSGNPAAICPLEQWLPDEQMQAIAAENNLSETAFFVRNGDGYALRWFTPKVEVDLCGHATLASAFVILNRLAPGNSVRFETKSGTLVVTRDGDLLSMDFPARPPAECAVHPQLLAALGAQPEMVLGARDYLVVYGSEDEVRALDPDMEMLKRIDRFAVIVTAPGKDADFVSRFFAPAKGVPEDPVTGSAHTTLIPYWSKRLGKKKLHAYQVSPRGGELWCEDRGERVTMSGKAVQFLEGTITL